MSCSRCGRSGHSIGSCFAKSSVHGRDLMSEKQMRCFRCGRNGHASSGCFARSTVDGRPLLPPSTSKHFQGPHTTPGQRGRSGVYVLQYANGMFYVGKSMPKSGLRLWADIPYGALLRLTSSLGLRMSTFSDQNLHILQDPGM